MHYILRLTVNESAQNRMTRVRCKIRTQYCITPNNEIKIRIKTYFNTLLK